ncbi:sulfotransferase family protein [Hyphococcus sp.]|uniref:sulfotransferase family protein n=1 Tax=Hyphococcus sp. TaxID=2038636 RepID=UPI002082F4AA|nr:MAG: hypothetical protein DHS20C04_19980 [Marinicaulis sp.]
MTALADRPLTPALAVPLCYALARTYDHLGEIENAFKWYAQGAALRDKTTPFDMAPYLAYLGRLRTTFTPELISRFQNESGGENLLIILSPPRSGTTLLEQILATSPKVTPTGEHMVFRNASLPLGSLEPVDMARADSFANKEWRQMAQSYQSGLRKRFGSGAVYTDKSLLNSNYAGLMRILFPQAKFAACVRDKRDTAWSCFRSHINANRWAQRHDSCAQFLHAQDEMQHHWAQIFGEDLVTIHYEDLVQDPGHTTQKLFTHAGLARPDDWDDFYKSGNPVATASLSQVRRPLNDASIGAWRRYEKYLAPAYDRYFP